MKGYLAPVELGIKEMMRRPAEVPAARAQFVESHLRTTGFPRAFSSLEMVRVNHQFRPVTLGSRDDFFLFSQHGLGVG